MKQLGCDIITYWYQKPTSSNRILNFLPAHPIGQKLSTIKGSKHRIMNICQPSLMQKQLVNLKKTLVDNSYLVGLIKKVLCVKCPFLSEI